MEQRGCFRCESRRAGENSETGKEGRAVTENAGRSKEELFARQASYSLRGIGILMVMASHYGEWYASSIGIPALTQFLTGLGRYGVDIFFVMSGYAMAKKAAASGPPGADFWKKRLLGTYVPYLILSGIIEIAAGGTWTPERVFRYLTAQDYWFIFNIMVFYLAFFAAFRLKKLRIAVLAAVILAFSVWLREAGRQDFWYVSNLAFPLGAACGLYEEKLLLWKRGKEPWPAAACTLLCIVLVPPAMRERALAFQTGISSWLQPAGNMAFSLWILSLPCLAPAGILKEAGALAAWRPIRVCSGVLGFLGRNSLYLYLLHAFLYYQVAGRVNPGTAGGFLAAFAAALLASWLFSLFWRRITAGLRKKERVV